MVDGHQFCIKEVSHENLVCQDMPRKWVIQQDVIKSFCAKQDSFEGYISKLTDDWQVFKSSGWKLLTDVQD